MKQPNRQMLVESVATLAGTKPAKEIAHEIGLPYSTLKSIAQSNGISLKYSLVDDHDKFLIRELKRRYRITSYNVCYTKLLRVL